jgi:hypothetical protein
MRSLRLARGRPNVKITAHSVAEFEQPARHGFPSKPYPE